MNHNIVSSNATDKKITIKRRHDGVYDIYLDDVHVGYRGSIQATIEYAEQLLLE